MKALIPSMKERKRYLLVRGNNLKRNIPLAIKEFMGVLGMSQVALNFIKSGKNYSIIAINREMLDKVRASLCIFKEKIIVEKVSGTLEGLGTKTL